MAIGTAAASFFPLPFLWPYLSSRSSSCPSLCNHSTPTHVFEPKSTSAAASVSAAAGANADGEVLRLPPFFSFARVAYLSPSLFAPGTPRRLGAELRRAVIRRIAA
jgi:hypothetical protein